MHQDSKVARPYAKSLLDFALEQNKLEIIRKDMALIALVARQNKALRAMLNSPVVKTDKKLSILKEIFTGKIDAITSKFIGIIVRKRREALIPDIAHTFVELYRAHENILLAEITTAVALNADTRKEALKFIGKISNNVELHEKVNPDLLGGFIIRVNDKQYDESISSRISSLKQTFSTNPYIAKI
jgi:F-type H+-transporting ATPase subunit delta